MKKVKYIAAILLIAGIVFAVANCSDLQQMIQDAIQQYQQQQDQPDDQDGQNSGEF